MCWQWARSSCAVAVVAPAKPHGQVQGSGCAQSSSTVPKRTLADLPRGTNTAILALVEKQALCSSCQLLLFHREPGFPKSMFFLGFIFCSRIGYNAGVHISLHFQRKGASVHPLCVPHASPSQGRTKGTSSPCPTILPCTLSGELTRAKWSSVCPWENRERTERHC